MAYTNLTDLKSFLGVTGTSEDTLLNLLIPQVSAAIDEYLGRTLGTATYTEYYCGNGQAFFVLNQRPVTSITSLYLDDLAYWGQASDAFAASTLLTQGTDYALDKDQPDGSSRSGRVYNINGYWSAPFTFTPGIISPALGPFVGNIKITYVGGYGTVPAQVELAANMAIAKVRNMASYGQQVNSEGFEEYNYSLAADSKRCIFSPEVSSMLARYRNVSVA